MAHAAPAEAEEYREWPGGPEAVRCWWEQRVGSAREQRVVPDGSADIIVFADGPVILVGPAMRVALPRLGAGTHVRGLRFRTEALATALGLPAAEIRELTLPLSAVLADRDTRRVREAVWSGRFPEPLCGDRVDARVRAAVRRLWAGADPGVVAAEADITGRHLRRLLLAHTGLGPRSLQRVGRFQRFLCAAESAAARPATLALRAAGAGYADQAHLAREVRELTGLTPSALLRERSGRPV
ncbi:MAG TPA: helix-turn-helix domain-containing protein [Amycolatopsis sp.]|nr:helix-turn-helix domain-containing protein [Amycolatopsis sp.]